MQEGVHVNDNDGVETFLANKVNEMIDAAVAAAANTRAPMPPLVRLKVFNVTCLRSVLSFDCNHITHVRLILLEVLQRLLQLDLDIVSLVALPMLMIYCCILNAKVYLFVGVLFSFSNEISIGCSCWNNCNKEKRFQTN